MKIIDGGITAPQAFLAQGVCAQIKNHSKKDLGIIYSKYPCSGAGVFTTNRVRAACIDLNSAHLYNGQAQAIVVNSGNANACTGVQGAADAQLMADYTADLLGLDPGDILVASTGVIGVPMPMSKLIAGINELGHCLSENGSSAVAEAIMTTDLVSKEIAVEIELQGVPVRIAGVAKGSGMIHPNMATMLAFITTDAAIEPECLSSLLKDSVNISYNMISVDRDTSTNDMAIILANGQAGNPVIADSGGEDYKIFKEALDFVNITLAQKIARDGEGAQHLIEIKVINAAQEAEARIIARSISSSNLIKAAVFGADANWGRILAAAGYSGADFDPNTVDIYLGQVKVAQDGMGMAFNENRAQQALKQETVVITVDLKAGSAQATAWGCDLTYDYVKINADYRS
ncbi:MAG: bifunctional glutamate N-acetyltransferase/amino-acid acetyltransferase ArgJ [Syntrophomonadaceae bacterium]|nr:bifunctional glutamate N-acetyltransferase/amino-acid acetyltransferase ArgJ [Syntrophomonadaceae bacterium]